MSPSIRKLTARIGAVVEGVDFTAPPVDTDTASSRGLTRCRPTRSPGASGQSCPQTWRRRTRGWRMKGTCLSRRPHGRRAHPSLRRAEQSPATHRGAGARRVGGCCFAPAGAFPKAAGWGEGHAPAAHGRSPRRGRGVPHRHRPRSGPGRFPRRLGHRHRSDQSLRPSPARRPWAYRRPLQSGSPRLGKLAAWPAAATCDRFALRLPPTRADLILGMGESGKWRGSDPACAPAQAELDSVGDLGVCRCASMIRGHARGCFEDRCSCRGVRCRSAPGLSGGRRDRTAPRAGSGGARIHRR
jgi:hypothetical protein